VSLYSGPLNLEVGEANVSDALAWQPSQADEMDIREVEEGRPAVTLWGLDISTGKEISNPKTPLTDPTYAFALRMSCYCVDTGAALNDKENNLFWEIDSEGTKIPAATAAAGTYSTYELGGCSTGGYSYNKRSPV
jgi:hypothetical protein